MSTDARATAETTAAAPDTSFEVVVVSYRSREQVAGLLAGLPADLPVAVVDNARGADGVEELTRTRTAGRYVDTGGGAGYARAANLGVRTSRHPYVVLVNPDTRPTTAVLEALVRDVAGDPTCASSAALNVGPDGTSEIGTGGWEPTFARSLVHATGAHALFPRRGLFARPAVGEEIDLDWTTGAVMAVRRELFLELGGLDERYFVYSEDVAYGRTARERGLHQVLRTDLPVAHASGGSGAPSLEMMRLRGASFARYVATTRRPLRARTVAGVVGTGYLVRAVRSRAGGDPGRAREHLMYARGAFTGRAWVAGEEVTGRE
ncbi:glycosyltransferase [Nocardioides sp. Arc9.136]|uniref:glycosyltransferase n=1 Tax=Nocardioides sp. Arc9.136 TaxID=2996826 RepID=UPI0026671C03|nr:glycosyltransferase [Nocardioides sp. Arc9.136]WKN48584.1 glycosyltransferase [Nocardioides sp. Arc9.136]